MSNSPSGALPELPCLVFDTVVASGQIYSELAVRLPLNLKKTGKAACDDSVLKPLQWMHFNVEQHVLLLFSSSSCYSHL